MRDCRGAPQVIVGVEEGPLCRMAQRESRAVEAEGGPNKLLLILEVLVPGSKEHSALEGICQPQRDHALGAPFSQRAG